MTGDMMQSDVMVGGRCLGKPWRVGIAGVACDSPEQLFVLDDSSWEPLWRELPLQQLKAYGDAHGLIFERVVTEQEAIYDALLLVSDARGGAPLATSHLQVRRYLLLRGQQPRFSSEQEVSFARIFLPLGEPFTDGRLVCLNSPLNLPVTPSSGAQWRICADTPELPGLLPPQWRECMESGDVPVHVGEWSVPAWLPPGSYIDARDCVGEADLIARCNERFASTAAVLAAFRTDKSSYPYSTECWIAALTAAIAGDAAAVRGSGPLLSVIIPAYNYGRFLKQAISSVLDQGYDDIEILVLDNASTDGTAEVVASFAKESCVRYLRNSRNVGPSYNVLNGIQIAQGRYLSLLMADDYYNPGYLSRLLPRLLRKPEAVVGYTSIRWVNEQGQVLAAPRHPGYHCEDYDGGRNEVAELLIHDSYIPPSAALIQREPLLKVWRRDPLLNGAGDWLSMLQVAEKYPDFVFLSEPGVTYRAHAAQLSTEFYSSNAPLADHIRIVEGVFERNAEGKLRGRELEVAAHLRRRLALYPGEKDSPLGARVHNLCERLKALAAADDCVLFSIILTTFNRPNLLKDALTSIGQQTLRDFDVVLVNDNGEPVEHLLEAYDFPITYLRQGRNRGPAAARNAAMRLTRGQYVLFLDDDDLYLPNHLQELAAALEAHPDSVVYTDAVFILERIEIEKRIELGREQRYPHGEYSKDRLLVDNYIPINTFACPRALALEVGDFDESLAGLEDWDFLMRLCSRRSFHHIQRETVQVRMRQESSTPERRSQQALKDYPALYRELYSRHSDLGQESLRRKRQQVLERLGASPGEPSEFSLKRWLRERLPTPIENRLIADHLQEHKGGPLIGVVVLDTDGQSERLMVTLKSLIGERCLYATLRILVITTADTPATSVADKLHFLRLSDEPLALQINRAVEVSDCQWFMLARAGDEFTQSGLMIAGLELAANPECRAVYGDQLQRLPDGSLGGAFLPGFNLDLLLSFPLVMARHWLYRRDLFLAAGGFDAEYPEAFEFELLTRLIEQDGLVGLGHIDEPLLITEAPTLRDNPDERLVIERHLGNRGYQAQVLPGLPARYRLHYGHASSPLVSILLSTDVALAALQRCIDSLLEKTRYGHYELLLADGGTRADVSAWLGEVAALGDDKVRVLATGAGLAQNRAAEQARGEYLLLLSGEAAIINEDWLDELLNHAQRPEVGVVGGKLLTPNGRIAQAGLLLGVNGPATPAFAGEPMDAAGYMQRLQVDQNYSAVGDACLMVRAELFRQIGGLDATLTAFRDVDLCLKVRAAGYLTVWAANAVVLHEAQTPHADPAAEDQLYERYLPQLANDTAYNRNLALSGRGFDLESDVSLTWRPLSWRPVPVVLAHPADPWGCGHYRVIQPFAAMKTEGLVDGTLSMGLLQVTDLERYDPDVIVLQRQIGDERLEAMRRIRKFSRAFTVYELDDYLPNLPLKSVHRAQMPRDILRSLRRGLEFVDRFVVSTQPLAEAFAGLHEDIRVIENRLPVNWWKGLESQRRRGRKPRVGWAGGVSHTGDLDLIVDVVRELASEVEWVFMGMCPDVIRPHVKEIHAGVDIEHYPAALAGLDLDLALAPVEQNLFNECKSNLRLLEYGACGFPVVCSDLVCYRGDLPVTRVKNRFRDWVEAIRMHINDLDATAAAGDRLREVVLRDWMLEGTNLERWRQAWLAD